MEVRLLCNNVQELQALAWRFLDFKCNGNKALWPEADLPVLTPFFDWNDSNRRNTTLMSEEVEKGCDRYLELDEQWGDQAPRHYRDSVTYIDQDTLVSAFGFKCPEETLTDDELDALMEVGDFDKPVTCESFFKHITLDTEVVKSFPVMVVGTIDSDFGRGGSSGVCMVYHVFPSEFVVSA